MEKMTSRKRRINYAHLARESAKQRIRDALENLYERDRKQVRDEILEEWSEHDRLNPT